MTLVKARTEIQGLKNKVTHVSNERDENYKTLESVESELKELKSQDQIKINSELRSEINAIQKTYDKGVLVYESLLKLRDKGVKTTKLDESFAEALASLSDKKYTDAEKALNELAIKIEEEDKKLASTFTIPPTVKESASPPGSGYARQSVPTAIGNYMVSLIAADMGSTKVIVDTASDSDCSNNCPVLPLSTYVSRNGAFAGINGTYFCPASYPTCAGKTNSFDLLVMNKNKTYFNSSNNVYSTNPAVIFGSGYIRFVSSASQWGRDTGVDGVLSNYPLLLEGGNVKFGGDDDPKKGTKGNRSFVGSRGNTIYIGVAHNVTVAENAIVLKALGLENAMNLDSGGSTALWSGGYRVGPGRDIPNAILFVRK